MCMLTEAYSLKPTRIVVFDFEFAQFGRNTYGIFSEELATLNEFLLDLGAWKSGDIVTDWIENGEGKLLYQNFGASLLTPEGLKRRTEELVQEEQSRHEDSEADKAWREMYDAQ